MIETEIKLTASRNLFSKVAICFSLINLILINVLFSSVPTTIKVDEGFPAIPKSLIMVTELSCFLGLIISIASLVRREKLKYWKTIGIVLNILFFLFLLGTFGFAFLMDWKRNN